MANKALATRQKMMLRAMPAQQFGKPRNPIAALAKARAAGPHAKPADLIPELQGRFPIRVELDSLSVDDFERILIATDVNQVKQYQALLATEGVTLDFKAEAIRRLAEIAFQVNEKTENIGARRLYTVLEKLLEEISFDAGKRGAATVNIDAGYVDERLGELARNEDLARYVL